MAAHRDDPPGHGHAQVLFYLALGLVVAIVSAKHGGRSVVLHVGPQLRTLDAAGVVGRQRVPQALTHGLILGEAH